MEIREQISELVHTKAVINLLRICSKILVTVLKKLSLVLATSEHVSAVAHYQTDNALGKEEHVLNALN
jgi:hypothetical protein